MSAVSAVCAMLTASIEAGRMRAASPANEAPASRDFGARASLKSSS